MTTQEAIPILERLQEPEAWEPQISRDAYEALELAIEALSKHQADKKLFGHGYWLVPGEVFISHNVLNEVLNTITKSINTEQRKIDSTLVKTAENDEAIRTDDHIADSDKIVDLKMRTITERLIIAKSLIDSVITDPESDQFREDTKKIPDGPDTNVGSIRFKPGDKFILELGQERKMFGEFEIAWTDLYVETSLLEKLKRYEPEVKTEKIPYKKPEIIDIAKVTMAMAKGADMVPVTRCKDCKYSVDEYNDGDCYCRRPKRAMEYVGDWNFFCGAADRKEK